MNGFWSCQLLTTKIPIKTTGSRLIVSVKMARVVITICLFAIITQQTQCSPYYDDKQSVKASCINFMNQDNKYILDTIRSTALRLKDEDNELTESMNEVLNDVDDYECLDCKSNGNSSACSCSTLLPTNQDDVAVLTKMMNDRPLWRTTAICDRVSNKVTVHNNSKIFKAESRFVAIDLISSIIEIIGCIVVNDCFRKSISPRPSINPLPSALGTKGPTFVRTIAPTRVPSQFVSSINSPCREGLISSDRNNDTYIDKDEYLVFIGTQGCEEPTEMNEDLAYAFRQICFWTRLVPPYTTFSIASVYGDTSFDRARVDFICDETAQAIEKEGCSPPTPRFPDIPWLPPVYIPPLFAPNPFPPLFAPNPTPTLMPILPAPVPMQPALPPIPSSIKMPSTQAPAAVAPNGPVSQNTAIPSYSIGSKKCIEFFFESNTDNNTRFNESEYLNFVILRTECGSLRSLPQQQAATLLSWCEQDFDAQSCKSKLEFAIDDQTTFDGRLNTICVPITLDCLPLVKSDPVLASRPSPIPVQIPIIINAPTSRPEGVPSMLPDIDPTSVPERPKVQSLYPSTSNPTKPPTVPLQQCIDALAKADSNDDSLLDFTEYTAFMEDSFLCPGTSTLSESQLQAFVYLSCKCQKYEPQTCCLKRNARVVIAGVDSLNRSEMEVAELEDVCVKSQYARDNGCSEPSLAPNQSPVVVNPAIEVPVAGNSSIPVVSPTTVGYEDCGKELLNSDSDGNGFLNETEYLQFLRSYGTCNVTALTEQQTETFFKLVTDSGSNNRSIKILSADVFLPSRTSEEIELLKSMCYLEESCLPAISEESILDCTDKLASADTDYNNELDETEFSGFIVDYLKCPASRLDASNSFTLVTTALSTTTINIVGARNAEDNRSDKENANLRSICYLTNEIECQDDADKCSLNMLHADRDEDGMVGEEEYLRFVNKRSSDCDGSEYPYLSLAHRTTFQVASCLDCIIRAEVGVDCCHPHHARMSIDYFTMPDSKRSSLQKDLVRNICISTRCASASISFSTKNERLDLMFPLLLLFTISALAMVCIRLHYINVKS